MLQRIEAAAGLQRAVAVGIEQIVEELHVELVVLDDQDRLGRFRRRGLRPSIVRMFPGTSWARDPLAPIALLHRFDGPAGVDSPPKR